MIESNKELYVDGYVIPIKKNMVNDYKKIATQGGDLWMKYGALLFMECVGDDLNPDTEGMEMMPFPELTKMKDDETVIFSFIVYKSRSHRDEVNKKVMSDPKMQSEEFKNMPMPFEMKRMTFWWFKTIVNLA